MESFDDDETLDFFDVYLPDTNGQKLVIYFVSLYIYDDTCE